MNRIHDLYQPLEHFAIWQNGFSPEEIQKIVDTGELAEFNKGQVGSSTDAKVDDNIRDTDITWIAQSPENGWIYQRMSQIATRVNHDKYQFDLSHFQPFQYGKYKPGGHYTWHYDSGPNLPEHRKLSFVLGLTDPELYEGGELQLNVHGGQETPHSMKLRKGDIVVFPSWVTHRVTPVISGERMTMVGWAVGPKFK